MFCILPSIVGLIKYGFDGGLLETFRRGKSIELVTWDAIFACWHGETVDSVEVIFMDDLELMSPMLIVQRPWVE